jgi:hypothetical protein
VAVRDHGQTFHEEDLMMLNTNNPFVSFLLQRAKAFVGAASAGVMTVLITTFEQQFAIQIPSSIKATVIAGVAGVFVHNVPNKAAPAK